MGKGGAGGDKRGCVKGAGKGCTCQHQMPPSTKLQPCAEPHTTQGGTCWAELLPNGAAGCTHRCLVVLPVPDSPSSCLPFLHAVCVALHLQHAYSRP